MVCDNNYISVISLFLLEQNIFVTSSRMVLKLTCNKVPVFTCSLIGVWDAHVT